MRVASGAATGEAAGGKSYALRFWISQWGEEYPCTLRTILCRTLQFFSGRGGLVGLSSLHDPAAVDAAFHADAHARVAALDALADVRHFRCRRRSPQQGADDLQRLPGMGVVVGRMQLQPAQAGLAHRIGEALDIGLAFVNALGPVAGRPFDRVIGGRDAGRQRAAAAYFLAPARERLGA